MTVSRETSPALDELAELAAAELDQAAELAAAELAARSSGQPVVLEFGRYRVFQAPDGGWVIARAVDTCQRCQECGCGDQAEPIAIPAMVIRVATMQGGATLREKLKALRAQGGPG